MAKKKISEKITTTTKFQLEGTLNLDDMQGFLVDIEDEGEVDITQRLSRYNGRFGVLTFTVKEEQEIEE